MPDETGQDRYGASSEAHEIEAIPNSGGGVTHYCHRCGAIGVNLAPELPCSGMTSSKAHYPAEDR